jgi:hypothetical protein
MHTCCYCPPRSGLLLLAVPSVTPYFASCLPTHWGQKPLAWLWQDGIFILGSVKVLHLRPHLFFDFSAAPRCLTAPFVLVTQDLHSHHLSCA